MKKRQNNSHRATVLYVALALTLVSGLTALPGSIADYVVPAGLDDSGCSGDTWTATSTTNAPTARQYHTGVWTGSEMIIWGGSEFLGPSNTGGRYNPSTDSWAATSTANAPLARTYHVAVWTGTEMIVWGGNDGSDLNTGGKYNPTTNSWTAISTTNAPAARQFPGAVWTGTEMIVWGGGNGGPGGQFNTGGRYNPSTDSWTAITSTNAPTARFNHTVVWTGNEMIVWGGYNNSIGALNTGGRYNPSTDSWTATSTTSVPTGRQQHTAVWTGDEMIVWDGFILNTGGRYNPGTNSWTATSTTNVPAARYGHSAVWTGSEMIIWGGEPSGFVYTNTGGRYNDSTNSWTATSTTGAPTSRDTHTAVWTGSEMIVWGGYNGSSRLNTGGRYCVPQMPTPTPTPTPIPTPTPMPTPAPTPTATAIRTSACVVVTATSGNVGPTGYANVTAAFNAINAGIHQGAINIAIFCNTTETTSAVLNASGFGAASYTSVTVSPAGGGARIVSGTISGALISLEGATNVTIDGLNTGGNSLTLDNPSTGGAQTIRFVLDAKTNTVTNCTIKGAGVSVSQGTVFFNFAASGGTGNTGNTISNNTITNSGANFPANAIYSSGTMGAPNSGTISGNNIQDYFRADAPSNGILIIGGNTAWTISNNRLFQTTTRLYPIANTHAGINVRSGSGYTINNNVVGFANSSGTGSTNLVGNSVALPGFPTSYTPAGTANATRYIGIDCGFDIGAGNPVSNIQGNTVAGIALYSSSGAATTTGVLCGIELFNGNANIGTTTGNTIGATSGGGGSSPASLYAANTTDGGAVVGIFATGSADTHTINIQNNTIGSIDSVGTDATISGAFAGIDAAGAGLFNISNNVVGNATADNIRTGYTLSAGNLSNAGTLTSTTGTTSPMVGVRSSAAGATVNLNSNTLRGWVNGTTAGGALTGVAATGFTSTTETINSNLLGTAALGWIRYAFANSGTVTGISLTGSSFATTHQVQNNNFQGIVYSVSGSGPHTYITTTVGTFTGNVTTISGNTFTNLNVNTTGTTKFIAQNYNASSTGTKNTNNNSIVTGFVRGGAGGTVTLIEDTAASVGGSTSNCQNNNFSNITLSGTTSIVGFDYQDGGSAPTRTVTGNTLSNWTVGSGAINCMNFTDWNGASSLSSNTITNIGGQGSITGITLGSIVNNASSITANANIISGLSSTGSGGDVRGLTCSNTSTLINLTNNDINTLSSSGASSTVTGIQITAATTTNVSRNTIRTLSGSGASSPVARGISVSGGNTVNVFKNKICDISESGAITTTPPSVTGLLLSGGTTVTAHNNLIGDLRSPSASLAEAIRGIAVTSATASTTYNVYYNTIYLNAASTGTDFGTTGVFHTASTTATTATLNLRNNIIDDVSIPNGTGLTVAHRRSGTALNNYGASSNNNDFYAGIPDASHLIYNDTVNADQTLAAYKTRVATRDAASVTQDPPFLSTTCGNANFLHINPAIPTLVESGAANIGGITDDYDNDIRQGNGGYIGSGTAPDIGADEFNSIIPTPTPTPTPTPAISISGTVIYCSNPSLESVPGVTLTLTGTSGGSTLSDSSGNYTFTGLASGGSYTVTPSKAALPPGSAGINTVDVIAVQRHLLNLTLLSGCRLMAADVDQNSAVNTVDVIAMQRFALGLSAGVANTGQYKFMPVNRTYPGIVSNQTAQNYDTLVFGDVASSYVHRPGPDNVKR